MREARTRATAARTLRVLLVEDSENDAMLLLRELRRGGYEPLLERVHTQEGMEEAWCAAEAAGEPFQIVISDYFMPRFGASTALKLLRKLDPDVPFIVVSGKVGEEEAVEIMSRLCPAIERELREVEVKGSASSRFRGARNAGGASSSRPPTPSSCTTSKAASST